MTCWLINLDGHAHPWMDAAPDDEAAGLVEHRLDHLARPLQPLIGRVVASIDDADVVGDVVTVQEACLVAALQPERRQGEALADLVDLGLRRVTGPGAGHQQRGGGP